MDPVRQEARARYLDCPVSLLAGTQGTVHTHDASYSSCPLRYRAQAPWRGPNRSYNEGDHVELMRYMLVTGVGIFLAGVLVAIVDGIFGKDE